MNKVQILDHGYVGLVESWGSDERIIEAARMSTGKGFLGWGGVEDCESCDGQKFIPSTAERRGFTCDKCAGTGKKQGDEKLLKFLYDHKHHTPFEMAGMIIEVQAPIFVFREWHRHRTQFYNEMSARYVPLPDVNYVPTVDRLLVNSKTNKQDGVIKGSEELTAEGARQFQEDLESMYRSQESFYQRWLTRGVPKELARIDLPVGRYSRMRAGASLRNWLGFLTLRMDAAAQYEIRQFANAVGDLVAEQFPRTWELFVGK